jgi:UDP-2-acetamido-3-amino-2,3-dideoxy-glucuronate N-acetyltransferase
METIIHPSAILGPETKVGQFSVISEDVRIGVGCQIGHHVIIHPGTVIGDGVRIDDHATIGKQPMKAAASALTKELELEPALVGDNSLIGTSAILYRGSEIGNNVLVADQASVREQSSVGAYTIIGRGVTIENKVDVGHHCKIETGAYIAGPSTIGNYCFIAPEVTVTNDNFMGRTEERKKHFRGVTIEDGGRVGANATILPGRTICADGVAAAGAAVTHDIPPRTIVAGVPARPFRHVPEEQLLTNQVTHTNGTNGTNGKVKDTKLSPISLLELQAHRAVMQDKIA